MPARQSRTFVIVHHDVPDDIARALGITVDETGMKKVSSNEADALCKQIDTGYASCSSMFTTHPIYPTRRPSMVAGGTDI